MANPDPEEEEKKRQLNDLNDEGGGGARLGQDRSELQPLFYIPAEISRDATVVPMIGCVQGVHELTEEVNGKPRKKTVRDRYKSILYYGYLYKHLFTCHVYAVASHGREYHHVLVYSSNTRHSLVPLTRAAFRKSEVKGTKNAWSAQDAERAASQAEARYEIGLSRCDDLLIDPQDKRPFMRSYGMQFEGDSSDLKSDLIFAPSTVVIMTLENPLPGPEDVGRGKLRLRYLLPGLLDGLLPSVLLDEYRIFRVEPDEDMPQKSDGDELLSVNQFLDELDGDNRTVELYGLAIHAQLRPSILHIRSSAHKVTLWGDLNPKL